MDSISEREDGSLEFYILKMVNLNMPLSVGSYSGNALHKHTGHRFSSKYNDAGGAVKWSGTWWYHNRHHH